MTAKVTFASARPKELRAEASLPALLERMLAGWKLEKRFKGKRVAIKMHLGGHLGYSTIHPLLVRKVVEAVRAAGGSPFLTDSPDAVANAVFRGYTPEVVGAPLVATTGVNDKYIYPRKLGFRSLKNIGLAGTVIDADALLVLSHGKGHGHSGFGGAIKNLAMGCVDGPTRGGIHRLSSTALLWDEKKCKGCMLCRDNCPNSAVLVKDGKIEIFDHHCKFCMHCQRVCPTEAITIDNSGFKDFQKGMALTTREVLKGFGPEKVFYITALLHITPLCDCWGFTTPAIVPDIGIIAGDDLVAVETAALDLIKAEDFIEGSLPAPFKRNTQGHLFQQIHGKDPYLQVRECEKIGLGSSTYRLAEQK